MKNQSIKGYIILGILFTVVSVIAFAVPIEKAAAFWIAYAFTLIAFLIQFIVWKAFSTNEETLTSKFLGFPVLHISITYLLFQLLALAVFLFVPTLPAWIAVIACVIILGLSAICMIAADAGRNEIERVEEKVQPKVFFIKSLQAELELIADTESEATVKNALTQLAEKVRFSDPMSCDELADVEKRIADKIEELKTTANKTEIIKTLNTLIDERNKKCKIMKGESK